MLDKIKSWLRGLIGKDGKGKIIIENQPFYIYKKRTVLDYLSLYISIAIGLLVAINLMSITGLNDKFSSKKHIGLINIDGLISSDTDANGESISKGLRKAFGNKNSEVVVLGINSGGGSPYQAEMVWKEVQYLKGKYPKKKVYAVIEDVGASAAYYIASSADKIIVGNTSIVGSIGVRMDNYDIRDLMNKVGVKERSFHAGDDKLAYGMTREVTPEQKEHIDGMLKIVHQDFINAVKQGRGDRIADNPQLYGGKFWAGEQSIDLGLADAIGDMNTLKREVKLDEVVNYTVSSKGLGAIFQSAAQSMGVGFGSSLKSEILSDTKNQAIY